MVGFSATPRTPPCGEIEPRNCGSDPLRLRSCGRRIGAHGAPYGTAVMDGAGAVAGNPFMRVGRALLMLMSIWLSAVPALAGNGWSGVARPAAGAPRVIGSYAAGCIAGAAALPLVGEGFQVMRPSRNRYYGHPRLVALVQRLGRHAAAHDSRVLVGDLAQPRGGPMPNGHRSHQVGLDVDVWFLQQDGGRVLSREEAEQSVSPSVIRAAEGEVDSSNWNSLDAELMKLAAQSAEVGPHLRQSGHQALPVLDGNPARLAGQGAAVVGPRRAFPHPACLPGRRRGVRAAAAAAAGRWLRRRSGPLGRGDPRGGRVSQGASRAEAAVGEGSPRRVRCRAQGQGWARAMTRLSIAA